MPAASMPVGVMLHKVTAMVDGTDGSVALCAHCHHTACGQAAVVSVP